MPEDPSPSARLLARELREHRERRGITGDTAAARLKWSPSKISRFDRARVLPPADDLERLIKLYRVPADDAARLRDLRAAAAAGRDLTGPGRDPGITELLIWAPDVIPAALRTEAYARAVMASVRRVRRYTPSEIKAEIVTDRLIQARLRGDPPDDDHPPLPRLGLAVVLDEAVLTRRRGGPGVMTAQLGQLAALAELDCADVRVLPLDADGPAFGAFTYWGFQVDAADAVLLTSPSGTEQVTADRQVTDYRFAFEELTGAAADPEESAAMIKRAADRWT